MQYILLLVLILLLCSHLPAAWPCLRAIRQKRLPRSIDLVGFSVLLFFDLEVAFEAFGGHYESDYFPSLARSEHLILWFILLLIAPWTMKLGYSYISRSRSLPHLITAPRLIRPKLFCFSSVAVCGVLCSYSVWLLVSFGGIEKVRAAFVELMGPLVIVFYLPMGVLAFWVGQHESRTKWGKRFTFLLMLLAIAAAAPVGERTVLLVPVLIVILFSGRPSFKKLALAGASLLFAAALLLGVTKRSLDTPKSDLFTNLFMVDLARAPSLAVSLENSVPLGSSILPYPGAGYVYDLLLYVPRSIAPFKGYSVTTVLTGKLTNTRADDTHWNLALGAIDEISLNLGWGLVPFGLFFYGCAFAFLDRGSESIPALRVATVLSAIWVMGYFLSALLAVFGAIALFGALWQLAFTKMGRIIHVKEIVSSERTHSLWRSSERPIGI